MPTAEKIPQDAQHKYLAMPADVLRLKKGDYVDFSPLSNARIKLGITRARVLKGVPRDNKRIKTMTFECVRNPGMPFLAHAKNVKYIYYQMPKVAEQAFLGLPLVVREFLIAEADYRFLEEEYPQDSTKANWEAALNAKNFWQDKMLAQLGLEHYLYGRT